MNSGTKTIAICNEKGGVGKTTTTVTLGATLTARGYRVLLVDADPQGSLTDALGWKNQNDIMVSLSGKLQEEVSGVEYDPKEGILHTPEGMDLMPATLELAGMERLLINEMSREFILKGYLERLEGQYDYILIDCSPSLGLITLNALTASDSVLIPVQAQYLPAKGMVQLLTTVARTRQRLNRNLKIDGIFLT
ncbi:MAG TPA: chromosome partitioning protein ParA, partial [Lachnospiraceae bacterium]|nr:chromosome partitioning protein ParA [Lachnospiraceae bacterium]